MDMYDKGRVKIISSAVLLGIALGVCWTFAQDFALALIFSLLLICLVRSLKIEDHRFIFTAFMVAFCLKIVFILFYYYFWLCPGNIGVIGPDGEVFSQRGWYISRVLLGEGLDSVPTAERPFLFQRAIAQRFNWQLPPVDVYQIGLFSYLIGYFYLIFGYSNLAIKCINAFLGTFCGIIAYFIARPLFGKTPARIALILTIFTPTLFLFSTTSLRDPSVNVLFLSVFWAITRLNLGKESRRILYLLIVFSVAMIYFLRQPYFYLLSTIVALALFFDFISSRKKRFVLVSLACIFLITTPVHARYIHRVLPKLSVPLIVKRHFAFILMGGKNTYRFYPQRFYVPREVPDIKHLAEMTTAELLSSYTKGVAYFMFLPFPWELQRKVSLFLLPQTLVWYFLFPFVLLGSLLALRYKFRQTCLVILALFLAISFMALGEGNIMAAIRHRDVLLPLFFIFASVGLVKAFARLEPIGRS
ncbi:MAG: glycosyltransferase family 39 protein [Candidatus Omnitrophica bacterium]|nr:glycosyltransferase family 39 protein [Candidatus Omnitrophota bacterium]